MFRAAPSLHEPHVGPERIEVLAIRIDGEHIVEGKTERDAITRAVAAGLIAECQTYDKNDDGEYRVETGYLTSHGRLVKAKEAKRIAREAGQFRRNSMWNYEPDVVPINTKRYWGTFSESHLKGLKGKSQLAEPPSATAGQIFGVGAPELRPVSRATKYTDLEGGPIDTEKLVTRIDSVEEFYTAYRSGETGKLLHVIEGYNLSDGSFITRDEARERFANADIGLVVKP